MNLRPTASLALAALLCLAPAAARADDQRPPATAEAAPRPIDLAICLDTSGSMEGLLDACRRKIWDVCTLLAQARPAPRLRVALVSFGGEQNADAGWVVLEQGLTEDLDTVYEKLMALRASGGTEYVGRAVHTALEGLRWSDEPGALRLVFVAGNESADQDRERDVRAVCGAARQHGLVLNAIFCGRDDDGDAASWRAVAQLGGGSYAAIDQQGTIDVPTPFDDELTRLSAEINATYLPFGVFGREGCDRQREQDANAEQLGASTAAARAAAKGSSVYRNGAWCLVDASQEEGFDWTKVKADELPAELRQLSPEQLRAHVAALRARRAELQARIQELGRARQAFVAAELARRSGEAARSFDHALAHAVRSQAEERGFRFE